MPHENAWNFDENRQVGDVSTTQGPAKWLLWYIIARYLGLVGSTTVPEANRWEMYYSCDGTDAGTGTPGDGVNRCGGDTYDASKIVFGLAAAARSWAVLRKMIGGAYAYVCLEAGGLGNAGTEGTYYRWGWGRAAYTGGNKTTRPSCADEITCGTSDTAVGVHRQIHDLTQSPCKVHSALAPDGSFLMHSSKDGSGVVRFGHGFLSLKDGYAYAVDPYNVWMASRFDQTNGAWILSVPSGGTQVIGEIAGATYACARTRYYTGSSWALTQGLGVLTEGYVSSATAVADAMNPVASNVGVDPLSGKPWGRKALVGCLWGGSTGPLCYRGRLPDITLVPSYVAENSVDALTPTTAVVGNFRVPIGTLWSL